MAKPAYPKAPSIPGKGNPNNLLPAAGKDDLQSCPCCGALWKNGQPWLGKIITPAEMAERTGKSTQSITQRIRSGTIAAYPGAGRGLRNTYWIPVFEAARVESEPPLAGADHTEDLGAGQEEVAHG